MKIEEIKVIDNIIVAYVSTSSAVRTVKEITVFTKDELLKSPQIWARVTARRADFNRVMSTALKRLQRDKRIMAHERTAVGHAKNWKICV